MIHKLENLTANAEWDEDGQANEYEIHFNATVHEAEAASDDGPGSDQEVEYYKVEMESASGKMFEPHESIVDRFRDAMSDVVEEKLKENLEKQMEREPAITSPARKSRHSSSSFEP